MFMNVVKTQKGCHPVPVQRKTGCRQCGCTHGTGVQPAPEVFDPFQISAEDIEISQEIVSQRDGLGMLAEMGITRHGRFFVLICQQQEGFTQGDERPININNGSAHPHFCKGRVQIVAASSRMEFTAGIRTGFLDDKGLHMGR